MLDFQLSTFIFQIINFFILLAALTWFLYRPLLRIMKKREEDISFRLRDADERAKKADEERHQLAEELDRAKRTSEQLLTQARAEAANVRERLLEQAHDEVAQLMDGAKRRIQEQESAAQRRAQAQVCKTAVAIAGNLIRQAVGPTLHNALLEELAQDESPFDLHQVSLLQEAISRADGKLTIEVAYPPSDEQKEQIRAALTQTLGTSNGNTRIDFHVEPNLVAGIRVLAGTLAVDLSVGRALEELSNNVRPGGGV